MATLSGLPGISVEIGLDGTKVTQGVRQVDRQFTQLATNVQRSSGNMRFAIAGVSHQVQDFIVQASSGTSAIRAFGQQAPQMLSAFGPQGAVIGTIIALVAGLGGAFLGAGRDAQAAAGDFDKLKAAIDSQIDSVDAGIKKYRELTQAQRDLTKLGLENTFFEQQSAMDALEKQLRETVLEFGQVGAAMAGITEGSGALTQLVNDFLTGRMGATRLAAEITDLVDVVGAGNDDFVEFAKSVRDMALELGAVETGSEQTRRRLLALDEVARGNVQTAEEIAAAAEKQAKAFTKTAAAAQELTDQQKRLAAAGRVIHATSAQEERFDQAAEQMARRKREQEQALSEQIRAQERAAEQMAEIAATPMEDASPEAQAATVEAFKMALAA